jgi:hypothetical protein
MLPFPELLSESLKATTGKGLGVYGEVDEI